MRIPKYCGPVKPSGKAYVRLDGKKKTYLPGRHGSKESLDAYDALMKSRYPHSAIDQPLVARKDEPTTVADLCLAFMRSHRDKKSYWHDHHRSLLRLILEKYDRLHVASFGPVALQSLRQDMIDHVPKKQITRKGDVIGYRQGKQWSRRYVNDQVSRVIGIFRWAATREIVSADVVASLLLVPSLRVEPKKIEAVSEGDIDAVCRIVQPVVADMIKIQEITGMRSQNLVDLRFVDIDTTEDVWIYTPVKHKTQHHGKELTIPLGPKCQALLQRYAATAEDTYIFKPKSARKNARYGNKYSPGTYRNAIRRACIRLGIAIWYPHRLRRNAKIAAKQRFGAEASRVYTGHSTLSASEIYTERDTDLAARVAKEIG